MFLTARQDACELLVREVRQASQAGYGGYMLNDLPRFDDQLAEHDALLCFAFLADTEQPMQGVEAHQHCQDKQEVQTLDVDRNDCAMS